MYKSDINIQRSGELFMYSVWLQNQMTDFIYRPGIPDGREIIDIYLDRYIVEDAFRITKSGRWVKMDPVFHWTDSKIRVHALTCMIALLLVRIAHKRARANGFPHGAERMLELLSSVNTAILLYPKSTKAVRIRCSISKEQEVLLTALNCQIPRSM